ncbi:MAG: transposase [Gaiellaceae bacterium]
MLSTLVASCPRRARWTRATTTKRVLSETRERGCVPIVSLRKGRPIPFDRIPFGSDDWKRLYRGRAAVEREFGRLKHEYGLAPLRTRGIGRVRIHADLTMLGRLGQALARTRILRLAA